MTPSTNKIHLEYIKIHKQRNKEGRTSGNKKLRKGWLEDVEKRILLTPNEVQKGLKISQLTVYKWLQTGYLPAIKTGDKKKSRWRVKMPDLVKFIEEHFNENSERKEIPYWRKGKLIKVKPEKKLRKIRL